MKLENTYFNRALYKGVLFELTFNNELLTEDSYYLKWNFKEDRSAKCFYLPITPDDLESAYSVENYCEYKGEEFPNVFFNDEEKTFCINLYISDRKYSGLLGREELYDKVLNDRTPFEEQSIILSQLNRDIPDSEILNGWEIHKLIDGFPFKGPEKVWVKRDGVWLR